MRISEEVAFMFCDRENMHNTLNIPFKIKTEMM